MANEEEGAGFVVRLMLETCQWLYCLFAILTGFCVLYGPNGGSKRLENGCWSFVSFPTHLEAVKSLTKISLTTTQIPIQNLQVGLCNFFFANCKSASVSVIMPSPKRDKMVDF